MKRFAIFGSALREDFGPDSDIDVLVEFEPGRTPGLLGVAGMESELSRLFGGRKVELIERHAVEGFEPELFSPVKRCSDRGGSPSMRRG